MKKLSLSILIIFMCNAFTFAQQKTGYEPYRKWEIGINAGVANFTGGYNMYKESKWNHFNHWNGNLNLGVGALVKKNFSHVFALEAGWNYSTLTGTWNETGSQEDFETSVNEIDLNTVWNINNLFSRNKFDRKIFWYAKLGLGGAHLVNKVSMNPPNDHHFKFPAYAAGTGVSFKLSENFKLNVGTQWSWINTDRLDGKYEWPGITMEPGGNVPNVLETKLYTHAGLAFTFGQKRKPVPVIEVPIPTPIAEPVREPEPIPEPIPEPVPEPIPEVKVIVPSVVGNVYTINFGLNFGFDKWDLNNNSTAELDRLVKDMIDNPMVDVELRSYTDSRGAASYNMTLSVKRGRSVSNYLISKGIDASRIKTEAFGETNLLNKCADGVPCTAAEHAINRRSEATITIRK